MFYKKTIIRNDEETIETWYVGNKISLPDGSVIHEGNKDNKYGWQWHEDPPKEYSEWLEKQNEI